MTEDYTVFVHLYDRDERVRGQKDSPPISGQYPTSRWQAGEVLVDRYEVQPHPELPEGEYRLAVGIYLLGTGARLPAEGDERLLMGAERVLLARLSTSR
jgi:hypothetical protein